MKLYCPACDDVYDCASNEMRHIDGAYFGTTFPMMLILTYPDAFESKMYTKQALKYDIKLFGFRVHPHQEKRQEKGFLSQ